MSHAWPCSGWGLPSRPGHPGRWCALTAPFHPYLCGPEPAIGGLFSVALSCGSPRLAVSQHPALWSPDLPRHGPVAVRAATTRPTHRRPVCHRSGRTTPGLGVGRGTAPVRGPAVRRAARVRCVPTPKLSTMWPPRSPCTGPSTCPRRTCPGSGDGGASTIRFRARRHPLSGGLRIVLS